VPTPDKTELWVAVALFVVSEVIGMSKAKDNSILQLFLRTARTFSPFEVKLRSKNSPIKKSDRVKRDENGRFT
jgi:hypothetical protein